MSRPDWEADHYHAIAAPQLAWGRALLDRLAPRDGELVIDAGCGSGRLTALLLERLPRGRVIAVDKSQAMLDRARIELAPRFGDRLLLLRADLTELSLAPAADAIFSAAALHWVLDPERLHRNLFAALKPGGRIVAQCGGAGNIARLLRHLSSLLEAPDLRDCFRDFRPPWLFLDDKTCARSLAAAGFVDVKTTLTAAPTTFSTGGELRQFLASIVVADYLAQIPDPARRETLLDDLCARAAADFPPDTLDYVRLDLSATRAPGPTSRG